jgi:chromosome segregation ATPase
MAEIQILHQDITMLKLRISALESQRNDLEAALAIALEERDQAQSTNAEMATKLQEAEKAKSELQIEVLKERSTSSAAVKKICLLEEMLDQALAKFSDSDSE